MGPRPSKPGARTLAAKEFGAMQRGAKAGRVLAEEVFGAPEQSAKPVVARHRGAPIVERRSIAPKLRPKPDAAAQLLVIADALQDLPRGCRRDPPELLLYLARHARALRAVALDGFEGSGAARTAPVPRMPFLGRARPDARAVAEVVFRGGAGSLHREENRRDQVGTVVSRKGRAVPVAIRRAPWRGRSAFLNRWP